MERTGMTRGIRRITLGGIAGLGIALVALIGAVLSPWAIAALDPPKPIDETATEIALGTMDRLSDKAKGQGMSHPRSSAPRGPFGIRAEGCCCGL